MSINNDSAFASIISLHVHAQLIHLRHVCYMQFNCHFSHVRSTLKRKDKNRIYI